MGSSTGGVEAVITILTDFPQNCAPTVITQHMPETFTGKFARRLNRLCAPRVEEATDGAPLAPGRVYIAPGGAAHLAVERGAPDRCRLRVSGKVNGHRPSVDVLFHSVAEAYGKRAVGVILSGMGATALKDYSRYARAGGMTYGQNEKTCVIYGMPKVAFELNAVQSQLPLSRIAGAVTDFCENRLSGLAPRDPVWATTAVSLAGEPRPARQFNVIRGEYKVSNDENAALSTVLGSCVACCMWDPMARVGGMNHFLVAGDQYGESEHTLSHGVYAMEVLINGLLKRGANRNCLKAKLFGGAAITRGLPDIGKQNSAFADRVS